MLVIRKEQMAVLEAAVGKRFREQLQAHLRQEFVEQTQPLSDAQLREAIDEGIRRGRLYGITTERDLMLFVDLTFILAPKFEEARGMEFARRVLLNSELDGEEKMSLIYQQLAEQQQPAELAE
jgi:hypothetical protein